MPERFRIAAIAAKIHAVEGVDPVPTLAANAIRHVGAPPVLELMFLDESDRADEQHGGMGDIGYGIPSGSHGKIDITLAIKGGGADYSAGANKPEFDPFLRAAGFSAIVSGGAGAGKIEYTTLDTGAFEKLAVYLWSGNKLFKLVDCVAIPKMSFEAAKRCTATFSVIGKLLAVTEAALGAQTLSAIVPPAFHSQAVTIGAFSSAGNPPLIVKKLDLDFGTEHTPRSSAGATDGLAGFEITNRVLNLSGEIEVVPLATFDPYTIAAQGSVGQTDTKVGFQVGAAQFNRVKFALGQWAFRRPPLGDSSGLVTWPLAGKINARSLASGREILITVD